MKTPFLVAIIEMAPSYPSGFHPARILGFGSATQEEAHQEAERMIAHFTAQNGREYRAEFAVACDVCKVSGKKPGCKRKLCEKCGGKGTISVGPDSTRLEDHIYRFM